MRDIILLCENPDCPDCGQEELACCQECEEQGVCEKRCGPVRWKQRLYSSDAFLVQELDRLASKLDNWLIAVAAERIRELAGLSEAE